MHTLVSRLPYREALDIYRQLKNGGVSCLFESASSVDKSSRMSMIGLEPAMELTGLNDRLEVRLLHARAFPYFDFLAHEYADHIVESSTRRLIFNIEKAPFEGAEEDRLERLNIVQPLRALLRRFKHPDKNFTGLYGALSYRFVYQFEDVDTAGKTGRAPDFHLFLFDNMLVFNHLTQDLSLYVSRFNAESAEVDFARLKARIEQTELAKTTDDQPAFSARPAVAMPDDETFKRQVEQGIRLCHEGELLEIVLSRRLSMQYEGDPLPLYERYRAINPSPYLFYFDFGDEILLGASPELMLRYENGRATLRPISGSVRRSDNPIEDHRLMMELLNSPKENSELDMLIDLGRNDLARICRPGIDIEHYRIIEKYSHVTHTVAQVSGVLQERYTGFDALIASLNAGTLTGAPKVAAMRYIEQIEGHTRDYYGGSIGWLLFDGDVNTAITIRTAHLADGNLQFCTGATLLYESDPESEWRETQIKAGAFMAAIAPFIRPNG